MSGTQFARLSGVGRVYAGLTPVVALEDVSLAIEDGDYVALVGPSGSGKSTLLNVLGLLDVPTSGTYWLDGYDVATLGEAERAALRGSRIGFVFQGFHLTPYRTALENVEMAGLYAGVPRARRRARARDALDVVGLSHRRDFYPTQLSGGEKQRVAIARALAGQAQLLLCDEPTGNLDSARGEEIIDLFERMNLDGHTIVVVTHDDAVARRARRCFHVRDGHVADDIQGGVA
ncbi:MAG: ABC transporter ATP-binding protein [Propionibacteriaceae bacterium]|nr:ABC transporter ATP-binding protein [Propionibacteriaceae bacterium]